jgi:hypothetical protein
MRKTNLSRLLARRVDGIHLAPFEQGEIGPDLFRHACLCWINSGEHRSGASNTMSVNCIEGFIGDLKQVFGA